ncbi:ATP-binding protein [Persephonella sp.]
MSETIKSVKKALKYYLKISDEDLSPFSISVKSVENILIDDIELSPDITERLEYLFYLFNLDEIEKSVLTTLFLFEVIPAYEKIFAFLNKDINKNYPTIGTFISLFSKNKKQNIYILDHFLNGSGLLDFGLINISKEDNLPFIDTPVKIDSTVRDFILGEKFSDDLLSIDVLPPNKNLKIELPEVVNNPDLRFIFNLTGKNKYRKKEFSVSVSASKNLGVIVVNPDFFSRDNLNVRIEKIFKSAFFYGYTVFFENFDSVHEKTVFNWIKKYAKKFAWAVFFDTRDPVNNIKIDNFLFLYYNFEYPSPIERFKLWKKYSKLPDSLLKELSLNFKLDEEQIRSISTQLKTYQDSIRKNDIFGLCRENFYNSTEKFVEKVTSDFCFEDIVLPRETLKKLKMVVAHYKYSFDIFESWQFNQKISNRSLSVLFTGSPGTGKSMAASILANEIGLDLYKIDLSMVVNKYVGETEKILSKIFDWAENAGIILFFDEADAIFGKRTHIKDSHDRFSNIEISYLLQRIENYEGVVILASNFKKNIDDAFLRRIRFVIDFPFPDENMRYLIWKKSFPEGCPVSENIDIKSISENFKLSGGNIKNAVLYAAFLAKERNKPIGTEEVIEGIRIEMSKHGKAFKNIDFQETEEIYDEIV